MHKYLRSIGFGSYKTKAELDKLIRKLIRDAKNRGILEEIDSTFCELRTEIVPGLGLAIAGHINARGTFHHEYYYPYFQSDDVSSMAECSIQRHTERETYAGLLDEYRVGISLIFYMENSLEYRVRRQKQLPVIPKSVSLTGLALNGTILLPTRKTASQTEDLKQAALKRTSLLEAARRGDEDAIETLTIEDIDLYSTISRRLMSEDIYSILESCFMPCGIECDQYSIVGAILDQRLITNAISGEEIYLLKLECNDLIFSVAVNKKDLLGEPAPGRRFKGQIWMQGTVAF